MPLLVDGKVFLSRILRLSGTSRFRSLLLKWMLGTRKSSLVTFRVIIPYFQAVFMRFADFLAEIQLL